MDKITLAQTRARTTKTVIPVNDGCKTELTPYPGTGEDNYENIDEENYDETTYNFATAITVKEDMYSLPTQTDLGTINFVTIKAKVKSHTWEQSSSGIFKFLMNLGSCSTEWESTDYPLSTTYINIQVTNTTKPSILGGGLWDWDDVSAMEIGVSISSPTVTAEQTLRVDVNADSSCTYLAVIGTAAHYDNLDDNPANYNTYVACSSQWNQLDKIDSYSMRAAEYDPTDNVLFTANGSTVYAYNINTTTGDLSFVTLINPAMGGGTSTNDLLWDGTNDWLYYSAANIGIAANDYSVVALDFNGTDFHIRDKLSLPTISDDPGIESDSECRGSSFGDEVRPSIFEMDTDGTYLFLATHYGGLYSYEYNGTTWTKKDQENPVTVRYVCEYQDENCYCQWECYHFSTVCYMGGYLYCGLCKSDMYYSLTEHIRLYSVSSGLLTNQDTDTGHYHEYWRGKSATDGSYVYIGADSYDVGAITAWNRSTNVLNYKGSKYDYLSDTGHVGGCADGYIWCSLSDTNNWMGKQLTFNGSTFTEISESECLDNGCLDAGDNLIFGGNTYGSYGIRCFRYNNHYDMFPTDYISGGSGTITKVKLYAQIWSEQTHTGKWLIDTAICSTPDEATSWTHTGGSEWQLKTAEWVQNPNTSTAWTWANIVDLCIGMKMGTFSGCDDVRISSLYAVIYYEADVNPEIRLTKLEAIVGYTPSTVTAFLNIPEEISTDYNANIKMLNFWSGNRQVYHLSRANKTVVLTGKEFEHADCASPLVRINKLKSMGRDKSTVSITDSGHKSIDREYKILSFGWNKISDNPKLFDWILELEAIT